MWYYNDIRMTSEEYKKYLDEGYIGFVYIITDTLNGMKYIGKKVWISRRKLPPLKGQKRKRTKIIESDWKDYYGSSEEVKMLVEEHGRDRFHREILYLCKTKGEMSYLEMREQIVNDVLLKPDEYYNAFVGGKIHRNHVKNLFTSQDDSGIIDS